MVNWHKEEEKLRRPCEEERNKKNTGQKTKRTAAEQAGEGDTGGETSKDRKHDCSRRKQDGDD